MSNSTAVYTALFVNYDVLRAPAVIDDDADYIVFTDVLMAVPEPWQRRVVSVPCADPRKASRYYFDQSVLVLPDYEYTIMHGANAQLTTLTLPLLSFLGDNDIAAFQHPHRQNVYEEPQVCYNLGKDGDLPQMQAQMARYRHEGFTGEPFSACTLLVRRNTDAVRAFEKLWWDEVLHGSHRDQLSFDYCRWKCELEVSYIPGDVFGNPFFKVYAHVEH